MKRQARLFAIAELLRARRTGVTAESLADRFDVSVRTIYRDLDSLRDAALPLHAERGRGGGYALDKSYTLPPVNFTAREAAVLLTATKMLTQLRMLPFTKSMQSAMDKVRGALDTKMQRELERQMRRLQFVGIPAKKADDDVAATVEAAWFENAPLHVTYRKADAAVVEVKKRESERLGKTAPRQVTPEATAWVRIDAVVMERSEVLLNCVREEPDRQGEKLQLRLHRILKADILTDDVSLGGRR